MDVEPQIPDVLAMVLADDVHHDARTGKYSILHIYNAITAPTFPWSSGALIVYLAFTDGQGKIPITMRLVDAEETRPPVFEHNKVLYFPTPTAVVERAFLQTELLFPAQGEYRLQLLSSGTLLRERRVFVVLGNVNGQAPTH